ncbi:MAG: integrase domain-containing protein [Acidithiobacillus sp.]|nr:integrase domain-containing protein [Acidithiobacillus sp.]
MKERPKHQAAGGWKASLAAILKSHNRAKQDGSVASAATQDKRSDVLYAGFRLLREKGYKLDDVRSFRGKHIQVLAQAWVDKGLSASTIQNNLSIFRVFADWIGKAGMVERAEHYVQDAARRSTINTEDKSWRTRGIDVQEKIAAVRAKDPRVALQLELQEVFGLRAREAMQLRPHVSDQGSYLAVNVGTKGGRDRVVPIDTPEKRELLERAKTFAASKLASTSDPNKSLAQVKNHYYAVLRSCGITKKEAGVTSHGLRHQYANDRYQEFSGQESAVRGGEQVLDRDTDRAARLMLAEELGHSREDVTTHYLGSGRSAAKNPRLHWGGIGIHHDP